MPYYKICPKACASTPLTTVLMIPLWLIFVLLITRLISLWVSPLGLHGDEAQYWAWSKDLDWGYFTKPPLIAWVIWLTTSIFGDAEWAVRLSSPLLHSITGFIIFKTGQLTFNAKTGFWAAAIYLCYALLYRSSLPSCSF